MCRLLAYASPSLTSVRAVLGDAEATRFQAMARLHDDGWGTAWIGADDSVEMIRSSTTGWDNPDLRAALDGPPARARLLHLRLATDDMPIDERNSHPFLAGGIAFAHNGSIVPVEMLRELVDQEVEHEVRADVAGDTDSELYFALVRQELRAGATPAAALATAVARIAAAYPPVSLNAILLTPDTLAAVRSSAAAPVPMADFIASGIAREEWPRGHADAYFQMSYRRTPDGGYAITSAGLDVGDWIELPEDSVIAVDLATMDLAVTPVGELAGV